MVLFLLAFAATPAPAEASPAALAGWSKCRLAHAQVESTGSATDVNITLGGLKNCSLYKDRYAKALIRDNGLSAISNQSPASRAVTQLEKDQTVVTRRMLAFIRQIRQR
jgi:hypothetical protein